MIDWNALEKIGVPKASLEQEGLLDSMLKGYKTNKLVPLTLTLDAATIRMDARLSLIPMQNGQVGLGIHGIRKEPQLERPYFGHIFTEEDKKNLRESGNMGRVAELKRYTTVQCRTQGAGVHLSQGPGVQPAVPRRGTALAHPVEDAQRGAYHPG